MSERGGTDASPGSPTDVPNVDPLSTSPLTTDPPTARPLATDPPTARPPATDSPATRTPPPGSPDTAAPVRDGARDTAHRDRTAHGDRAVRGTSLLVTFVLGALTATPALSMDMYLPSLPQVTESLHASAAAVQITLTGCLGGMALGQLVVGPMSDKWGRRRPLLIGLFVYVAATAACALAPDVELLIVFRLAQGLAGAAGIVISRAVVRDLYDDVAMARFFSTLMLISGVAPIVAPLIGGQILRLTDWRGVFYLLILVGVGLTAVVWFGLPETLPAHRRHGGGVGEALRSIRTLLADREFSGYTLAGGFAFAALFAYISASPFVVQEIYGASPQTYSLLFGVNSIGIVGVGQINGKLLVGRVSLDRVLAVGLAVITLAAVALLLMTSGVFGHVGLFPIAAGLFVLMSAMGLALPNTNALALMRTPHSAGAASALIGTSSFLVGAIASPLVGIAGEDTAVPMAVVQVAAAVVAVGCFVGLCRPWRRIAPAGPAAGVAAVAAGAEVSGPSVGAQAGAEAAASAITRADAVGTASGTVESHAPGTKGTDS